MNRPALPKRFHAFTVTQGLGAFNDNVFKMLLQLYILQVLVVANDKEIIFWATFLFTLPFVLFGPWSGYFADRYPKHALMRIVKIAEIGVMMIGMAAFYLGNLNYMIAVLFLMAVQSTFFGPAKQGIIPEICEPASISHANSWIEMTTFFSIILGISVAGVLMDLFDKNAFIVTFFCIGFAGFGAVTSFYIPKVRPADSHVKFPWNPLSGIVRDLLFLKKQKGLWLAGLANSYFWLLGLIFSTNIIVYGMEQLNLGDESTSLSLLPAFIAVGIAGGSWLAGRWSGKKVELGLVPLGGLGLAFFGIMLYFTEGSYTATAVMLVFAGVSGGLYIVPLYAYLQFESKENEKGRVLASVGILSGLFLVFGSFTYHLLAVTIQMPAKTIYLTMGIVTIFVVIYICTVIPEYFIRFSGWLLTHLFYKIKIVGMENLPVRGPALIVPNHVSLIDSFLLSATVQRFIIFIMDKRYYDVPVVKKLLGIMEVIPIAPKEGKDSVLESLNRAKKMLKQGRVVCIFAEGKLTKDGMMNEFRTGLETVMSGIDCPIVPVYLHNVWGSIFSLEGGKFFWKWPKKIPYPVTVQYGDPLPSNTNAEDVEQAVKNLADTFESSKPSKQD